MNKNIKLKQEDIYKGSLILVNQDYPLKSPIDERNLHKIDQNHNEFFAESILVSHYQKLLKFIQADDKIICTDAYRSRETQESLYEYSLNEYGIAFTESYVAKVDCSEHQSGLAIDLALNSDNIDLIRPHFPSEGISLQFKKHCHTFGFIQRYSDHKKNITKISDEEWHYRYVGYPHSTIMKLNDYCLEEYHDFIKAFTSDNPFKFLDYEIYFIRYEKDLWLVHHESTHISGNNIDGFIVTSISHE